MKLHSDSLDQLEIRKAARLAGVSFTRFNLQGSRKRAQGFDVILTGSSPRRQNFGTDYAATWDEWGIFLGTLYTLDPALVTPYYENDVHFHWSTGGRFRDNNLRPSTQHTAGHKWNWSGDTVTGSYSVHACECGAIMRRLHCSDTFAEILGMNP